MVEIDSKKIDKLAVVPTESVGGSILVYGGIIYGSGDSSYAVTQLDLSDDPVLERMGGILRGTPSRTDGNLKQVLEVVGKNIERARIGRLGVELEFSDGSKSTMNVKAALPAALADGAELYVEDGSMRTFGGMDERLQGKVFRLLEQRGFHEMPVAELDVSPSQPDDSRYHDVKFAGADTYLKEDSVPELPENVKYVEARGVSVELEDETGEKFVIGHVTDAIDKGQYGSGDDLLRAAYVLMDESTEIKLHELEGEVVAQKPKRARQTKLFLDANGTGGYAVKLQSRPATTGARGGQVNVDIMERTLIAQQEGRGIDVYARFKEMGDGIADTASLEAKLLLDWLDADGGRRISKVYLDVAKIRPYSSREKA